MAVRPDRFRGEVARLVGRAAQSCSRVGKVGALFVQRDLVIIDVEEIASHHREKSGDRSLVSDLVLDQYDFAAENSQDR